MKRILLFCRAAGIVRPTAARTAKRTKGNCGTPETIYRRLRELHPILGESVDRLIGR